jgi:hypothetical protein
MINLLTAAAMLPHAIDNGEGILGTANRLVGELGTLAKVAATVVGLLIVVGIAIIKRTITAIMSAAVTGFIIIWLVNGGLEWGGKKVGEDLNKGAPAVVNVHVVSRPGI